MRRRSCSSQIHIAVGATTDGVNCVAGSSGGVVKLRRYGNTQNRQSHHRSAVLHATLMLRRASVFWAVMRQDMGVVE